MRSKVAELILELQPYTLNPSLNVQEAHRQSCSNDEVTMNYWRDIWIKHIKSNHDNFKTFAGNDIGKLYSKWDNLPMIIAGAGSSLKKNAYLLKDRPKSVGLISCLHNFHFLEDQDANVDYYTTLDAGDITIEEVFLGGKRTEKEYWDLTKNRTLLAYIGTHPTLLEKWQGEVLFYNSPIPNEQIRKDIDEIEPFNQFVETGGHVLGACLFIAKGYLGSQTSIYVGADFSFSNEPTRHFHAWDSNYDKNIGQCINAVDIFGNRVLTWQSYYNFKLWHEVVAQRIPGIYINCTEGGILGAGRDGNMVSILQKDLSECFDMLSLHRHKKTQAENPGSDNKTVFI